jgi:NRE family putative nickel resistance protein-like MFS transporter
MLGRATGRYERGTNDQAVLHGRRHRWTARALLFGGLTLGLVLLPGVLSPPLFVFSMLWILNGAGQALIAISSSTLLAEHTVAEERGRAYAAHFALTHACWLITYPAVGHAAAKWGAPVTFTAAVVVCLLITAVAMLSGQGVSGAHIHPRRGQSEPA